MKERNTRAAPAPVRMLRLPEVKQLVGLGRSTIYAMVKRGEFPAPVPLGARAVAWVSTEVTAWLEGRIATRGLARKPWEGSR